jgi:hypothetical protein
MNHVTRAEVARVATSNKAQVAGVATSNKAQGQVAGAATSNKTQVAGDTIHVAACCRWRKQMSLASQ